MILGRQGITVDCKVLCPASLTEVDLQPFFFALQSLDYQLSRDVPFLVS